MFYDEKGRRIQDKVYSVHSWRRAGHSRVSHKARHTEPSGTRKATETYKRGRWAKRANQQSEEIRLHVLVYGSAQRP